MQRVPNVEDGLLDDLRQVYLLELHAELVLLDAPQVQDVLQCTEECVSIVERAAQRFPSRRREVLVLVREHGDHALDDAVEGRAQLVAHLLDQIALQLLYLSETLFLLDQLQVLCEQLLRESQHLVGRVAAFG